MAWLRLPAVARLIIDRGHASNEAAALALLRPVISAGKLNLRGHQGDAQLRLPAKPPIDPNGGYRWLVSPQIDLAMSTILIPNYSNEMSWERLERRPRPEVIELFSEDVDRIWPPRTRSSPQRDYVAQVLASIYPAGIPTQQEERNVDLVSKCQEHIRSTTRRRVDERTILRAARRST